MVSDSELCTPHSCSLAGDQILKMGKVIDLGTMCGMLARASWSRQATSHNGPFFLPTEGSHDWSPVLGLPWEVHHVVVWDMSHNLMGSLNVLPLPHSRWRCSAPGWAAGVPGLWLCNSPRGKHVHSPGQINLWSLSQSRGKGLYLEAWLHSSLWLPLLLTCPLGWEAKNLFCPTFTGLST